VVLYSGAGDAYLRMKQQPSLTISCNKQQHEVATNSVGRLQKVMSSFADDSMMLLKGNPFNVSCILLATPHQNDETRPAHMMRFPVKFLPKNLW
jgi:hypothetical protein